MLLAAACLTDAPAAAAPKVHTVVMEKMRFGPVPQGIRSGDIILWVNRDVVRHTATARNKSFDVDLQPGASGRTVVQGTGSVSFYCRFHPGMKGVLPIAK